MVCTQTKGRYLREAFLLEVCDNCLSTQPRMVYHAHDVGILLIFQSHLEYRLSIVDLHLARFALSVEAKQRFLINFGHINRHIQGPDNTRITRQSGQRKYRNEQVMCAIGS